MERLVAIIVFLTLLGASAAAEPVEVGIEKTHPNGTSVSLRSIDWGTNELTVGILIVNAHSSDVRLSSASRRTFVTFSGDRRLELVPPEDNTGLEIPARSTVEGSLTFMGVLPAPGELTVVLNETGNDSPTTTTPRFEIVIPADIIEMAASKKN